MPAPSIAPGSLVFQIAYHGDKKDIPARGLFVLMAPSVTPRDPTKFSLAFCDVNGVPQLVTATDNPWHLAIGSAKLAKNQANVCVGLDIPHDFVFIAHPSPDYARALLASLVAGKSPDGKAAWDAKGAWPFQTLTPVCDTHGIRFYLTDAPELYLPKGAPAYAGWSLYYRMPYAHLDAVKTQVQKLAVQLGSAAYPAGIGAPRANGGAPDPYLQFDGAHDGEFDIAVAAALHRFQRDIGKGSAHKMDATALATGNTCAGLLGSVISVPAIKVLQQGMTDEPTSTELERWKTESLRMPGSVMVPREPPSKTVGMYGQPQLWWRLWALEALCKVLGAPYMPGPGNSHRHIGASGAGQVSASYHKVGRAFDLNFDDWVEPPKGAPLAFEADWRNKGKKSGVVPRWILYVHSGLDPLTEDPTAFADSLRTPMKDALEKLEARIKASLGGALIPDASTVMTEVSAFAATLLDLAAAAGDAGNSTALGRDYFRHEVQRFQWQGGEINAGSSMPPITAPNDAKAVGLAASVRTWLNFSRLAYQIGLHSIGAHSDFRPVVIAAGNVPLQRVDIGANDSRWAKAIELDKAADGIERAMAYGLKETNVYKTRANPSAAPDHTLTTASFDLDALRKWMARPSDDPGALPMAQPEPLMSYAKNGVDLSMQVLLEAGDTKTAQETFLQARDAIRVRIVSVGKGLALGAGLAAGDTVAVGDLRAALKSATNVPGDADHRITLRPIFHPDQPDADPGAFAYEVSKLAEPATLEWWHLELAAQPQRRWEDWADDMGLAKESIAAPPSPTAGTTGPAWQGGPGYTAGDYSVSEPPNAPFPFSAPGPA